MGRQVSQQHLDSWNHKQAIAEKMIPLLGSLYRGPSVVIRVFGQKIMNASTISIIKAHQHGELVVGSALDMDESFKMLMLIEKMHLKQCRLDLGKLCHEYLSKHSDKTQQEPTYRTEAADRVKPWPRKEYTATTLTVRRMEGLVFATTTLIVVSSWQNTFRIAFYSYTTATTPKLIVNTVCA